MIHASATHGKHIWCDARGHFLSFEDGCLMLLLELRQEVRPLRVAWWAPGTTVFCALPGKSLGTWVVLAKWLNLRIPTHVYRHRLWRGITTHPVSYSCICFLMLYLSMINNCLWDRGRWSYLVSSLQRISCLLATISQFGKNKFFLGTETSTQLQYQYNSWIYLNLIFFTNIMGFSLFVCLLLF